MSFSLFSFNTPCFGVIKVHLTKESKKKGLEYTEGLKYKGAAITVSFDTDKEEEMVQNVFGDWRKRSSSEKYETVILHKRKTRVIIKKDKSKFTKNDIAELKRKLQLDEKA